MAALICFEAEYMCLMNGIRFINHSPSEKTVVPSHDEANMPTKNTNRTDVRNPSPAANTRKANDNLIEKNGPTPIRLIIPEQSFTRVIINKETKKDESFIFQEQT